MECLLIKKSLLYISLYCKNIWLLSPPPLPCRIMGAGVKSDFIPAGRKEPLYSCRALNEHLTPFDKNYYFIVWVKYVSFECLKLNFTHSMCKFNFTQRKRCIDVLYAYYEENIILKIDNNTRENNLLLVPSKVIKV